MSPSPSLVTQIFIDWRNGHREALDQLLPLVYDELRRLAGRYLRRERPNHTLQPTALVHEAYLQLIDQTRVDWQSRTQFFGVAANLMRQILVQHARRHKAAKRGGVNCKLSLPDAFAVSKEGEVDLVTLDDALTNLAIIDPQKSQIVELRFFGGLTVEEAGEVLGISPATIKREWSMAKAWLHHQIKN